MWRCWWTRCIRTAHVELPRRRRVGISMSPGVGLRPPPPPLLTPEGHPHPALETSRQGNAWFAANAGVRVTRGVGGVAPTYGGERQSSGGAVPEPSPVVAGRPLRVSKGGGRSRRRRPGDMERKGLPAAAGPVRSRGSQSKPQAVSRIPGFQDSRFPGFQVSRFPGKQMTQKNMPAFAGMSRGERAVTRIGQGVTSTVPRIRPEWPGNEQKNV